MNLLFLTTCSWPSSGLHHAGRSVTERCEILGQGQGKNAIEVGNMDDLVAALEAVKEAVTAGELDAQIEQASGALRDGFAKRK